MKKATRKKQERAVWKKLGYRSYRHFNETAAAYIAILVGLPWLLKTIKRHEKRRRKRGGK